MSDKLHPARILVRKKIRARRVEQAMEKIKKRYPHARLITYKFDKDFRYMKKSEKDYENRTMKVAFIDDFRGLLK